MSKKFNAGTSTIQRYESGERTADALFIARVAEVSDVGEHWILRGENSTTKNTLSDVVDVLDNQVDIEEFVFIPRYDVRAAAGFGSFNENEKPVFSIAFRQYWLHNHLNVDIHQLFVIQVDGSSLSGLLNDGDTILVNGGDIDPKEGVYVFRMDGHLMVKLVQRLPNNILSITSTDPLYTPFTIDMANLPDDFAVIGKVIWFGRVVWICLKTAQINFNSARLSAEINAFFPIFAQNSAWCAKSTHIRLAHNWRALQRVSPRFPCHAEMITPHRIITVRINAEAMVKYEKIVKMKVEDYNRYLVLWKSNKSFFEIGEAISEIALKYDFDGDVDDIVDTDSPEEIEFTAIE